MVGKISNKQQFKIAARYIDLIIEIDGEKHDHKLAEELGKDKSTISAQLKELRENDLVEVEHKGNKNIHKLTDEGKFHKSIATEPEAKDIKHLVQEYKATQRRWPTFEWVATELAWDPQDPIRRKIIFHIFTTMNAKPGKSAVPQAIVPPIDAQTHKLTPVNVRSV